MERHIEIFKYGSEPVDIRTKELYKLDLSFQSLLWISTRNNDNNQVIKEDEREERKEWTRGGTIDINQQNI